jgi:hypothetical protein
MLALLAATLMGADAPSTQPTTQGDLVLFSLKKPAPRIDGDFSDECWKGGQIANGFLINGKLEEAEPDAQVMSTYDDKQVYFAITVFEPAAKSVRVSANRIWEGDCVELFLQPELQEGGYLQLLVDSAGKFAAYDHRITPATEIKLPAQAASKVSGDRWCVEIAMPFEELRTRMPADNQRWHFNIGRERYAGGKPQYSSWASLGAFSQRDKFGKLAFYSKHEVQAAMSYWAKNDRDPLMNRPIVNGFNIASGIAKEASIPSLWKYDPYAARRQKHAKWYCYGLLGGGDTGYKSAKDDYPQIYNSAMGLNRCLMAKSLADEDQIQLRKCAWYASQLGTSAPSLDALETESSAIDNVMEEIYRQYAVAFDDNYNSKAMESLPATLDALKSRIESHQKRVQSAIAEAQRDLRSKHPWQSRDYSLPASEKRLNAAGAETRFAFSGMRFMGDEEIFQLFGDFSSVNIDWPHSVAVMKSPKEYEFPYVESLLKRLDSGSPIKRINMQVVFGSQYWMPLAPWIEEKAKSNPDIFLRSQDNQVPDKTKLQGDRYVQMGMNPNNSAVQEFMAEYLPALASRFGDRTEFFVTGWEDLNLLQVGPKSDWRMAGYNESNKQAFRAYLEDRYKDIASLNKTWNSNYASFSAIEPPDDRYIKPATRPCGLTFEFERWNRVNHVQYNSRVRKLLRQGAPSVPVMIDDSNFFLEGNVYSLMKHETADIYSFHSNPGNEHAMWTYLNSLSRRFGKVMGYFENYWEMYRNAYMADERTSKRAIRNFFFQLLMRDVRSSTYWLRNFGESITTDYAVAYGGGLFGLDLDQTILRWSSTEPKPMFQRTRRMERALLESEAVPSKLAVVQPCTTIFTLASMGTTYRDSPVVSAYLAVFNQALYPWNIPAEYVTEEMILDGKASLDEFRVLVLPQAFYMTPEFAEKLNAWIENGGTVLAMGPFAISDQLGNDLPAAQSPLRRVLPKLKRAGWRVNEVEWGDAKLAKGPALQAYDCGHGRIILLNATLSEHLLRDDQAKQLRKLLVSAATPEVQCDSSDLRVLLRRNKDGSAVLGVCNVNVQSPAAGTIEITGAYSTALDLCIDGQFPAPLGTMDQRTQLRVLLEPGDFTLLELKPAK